MVEAKDVEDGTRKRLNKLLADKRRLEQILKTTEADAPHELMQKLVFVCLFSAFDSSDRLLIVLFCHSLVFPSTSFARPYCLFQNYACMQLVISLNQIFTRTRIRTRTPTDKYIIFRVYRSLKGTLETDD